MKSNLFLTILVLSITLSTYENATAQSPDWLWAKAIGEINDDYCYSCVIDSSGAIYSTGYFQGTVDFDPGIGTFQLTANGGRDLFVTKLDSAGNFIWAKAIGGGNNETGHSIALDSSENVLITGSFGWTVDFDPGIGIFNLTSTGGAIFILKLDASGDFMWAKSIDGALVSSASSISIDPINNIHITGYFVGTIDFDPGTGIYHLVSNSGGFYVSKYTSSGNLIWAKAVDGTSILSSKSISVVRNGNGDVYVTGNFQGNADFDPGLGTTSLTSAGGQDIFVSKLDSAGNFLWAKAMGDALNDIAQSVAVDDFGNVYITGSFRGTVDFDPGAGAFYQTSLGQSDIFISKLDPFGNLIWSKQLGGARSENGYSLTLDASGNVYTTGIFLGTADFDPNSGVFNLSAIDTSSYDIFISKLNSAGDFVWAKSVGGDANDYAYAITLDANGNPYLAGAFQSDSISFGSSTLINAYTPGFGYYDMFICKLDTAIITGSNEIGYADKGILIYPNPVSDRLHIKFSANNKIVYIDITDIAGKRIYSTIMQEQKIQIDTRGFAQGLYLVRLQSEDFIEEKKILVTRKQ